MFEYLLSTGLSAVNCTLNEFLNLPRNPRISCITLKEIFMYSRKTIYNILSLSYLQLQFVKAEYICINAKEM